MSTARCLMMWAAMGFLAGCSQPVNHRSKAAHFSEADAVAIARQVVATNDGKYSVWLQTNVLYRARPKDGGWSVVAEIIVGTNDSGEPLIEVGGHRIISIDENGAIIHYLRGR